MQNTRKQYRLGPGVKCQEAPLLFLSMMNFGKRVQVSPLLETEIMSCHISLRLHTLFQWSRYC